MEHPTLGQHLIHFDLPVREALKKLDILAEDAILFLVDDHNTLLGSLTDGDIRRGFIRGLGLDNSLSEFVQTQPKCIRKGDFRLKEIIQLREQFFTILPVVDDEMRIIHLVNFGNQKSYLPVDAVIMAGGRGERLKPLTDNIPKPLLKVGNKPIIEHNVDRLNSFGIDTVWISVRYLGQQIIDYFQNEYKSSIQINPIWENQPLGTAGALSLIEGFSQQYILLMNSDLLTNIDFEDFFLFFEENQADLAVACIPYQVNIPYAVMETQGHAVTGFKEKPTYTHYSNAGIYLMKREMVELIPQNEVFNATDLMQQLIQLNKKVVAYPLVGYWLDIGKHEDYEKAQIDVKNIKL